MSAVSRHYIMRALEELEKAEPSHTLDHVAAYLDDALIWLDGPADDTEPPHPATMIGRR